MRTRATAADPMVHTRMPRELVERLDKEAERAGRSRTAEVVVRLVASLGEKVGDAEQGGAHDE